MLYRTLLEALCLTAALSATAKSEVSCPSEFAGRRLIAMSLFQGNPADQVDLMPATPPAPVGYVNVWNLRFSTGLVAVCRYEGGGSVQSPLPAGLSVCRVDSTPRRTTAGCR